MMTENELQLAIYVEGILRTRGYADVANTVANVVGIEAERRDRMMMQPSAELLDACRPALVSAVRGPSSAPVHDTQPLR